jgi:hypothetical protein
VSLLQKEVNFVSENLRRRLLEVPNVVYLALVACERAPLVGEENVKLFGFRRR